MPLIKSGKAEAVGKNIKKEMASGKSKAQSVAIALATERKYAKGNRKNKLEEAYGKYIEEKAWAACTRIFIKNGLGLKLAQVSGWRKLAKKADQPPKTLKNRQKPPKNPADKWFLTLWRICNV